MKVTLGKEGLTKTHQADFPETIFESHVRRGDANGQIACDGESRIAFVAHEGVDGIIEGPFVCDLHPNEYSDGKAWLHDCCAVAVYFCKKCLNATVWWNQG